MDYYNYLPRINCHRCEPNTCMAFALALFKRKVTVDDCPPLLEPRFNQNYETLKEMLNDEKDQKKELNIDVDSDICDGCGICVTICPVNARFCPSSLSGKAPDYPPESHQLFHVKGGKCELLNLKYCRRLEVEGRERECRICENYCPREVIKIF